MPTDLGDLVALMPFAGQLGLTLDEAGPERVVARLAWTHELCTAAGVMHGGVLMSLADTAGALAAFLGLAEGQTTATITSTTQMFRPVTAGTVRAVAVPLNPAEQVLPHRAGCPGWRAAGPAADVLPARGAGPRRRPGRP